MEAGIEGIEVKEDKAIKELLFAQLESDYEFCRQHTGILDSL